MAADFLDDLLLAFSSKDTPRPSNDHATIYSLMVHCISGTLLQKSSIHSHLTALKEKSDTHYKHSLRVGVMFFDLASQENLMSRINRDTLAVAGTAHDCGKDKIPLYILEKPARLSPDEAKVMKAHNRLGYLHLKPLYRDFPHLAEIVIGHHRYPRTQLARRNQERRELLLLNEPGQRTMTKRKAEHRRTFIPSIDRARELLEITDIYDALSSKRSYKPSFPAEQVYRELSNLFPKEVKIASYLVNNYPGPT